MGLPGSSANGPGIKLLADTDVLTMLMTERDRQRERAVLSGEHGSKLAEIHDILRAYNLHFGYRVMDECASLHVAYEGIRG